MTASLENRSVSRPIEQPDSADQPADDLQPQATSYISGLTHPQILKGFQEYVTLVAQISYEPLGPEHLEYYLTWFTDPKVRRNLSPTTPNTEETILAWLNSLASSRTSEYYFVRVEGAPVGHIGVKNIDHQNRTAELSLVLGNLVVLGSGLGLLLFFDAITNIVHDLDSHYILRKKGAKGGRFLEKCGMRQLTTDKYDIFVHEWRTRLDGEEPIPFSLDMIPE